MSLRNSNKMPVSWHKENVKNSAAYAATLEKEAHALLVKAGMIRDKNVLRQAQIDRAEAEGRDGYDADRFNVSKTPIIINRSSIV